MGRMYSASYEDRAVTTAVDLIEITSDTNRVCVIHSLTVTQQLDEGDAEAEMVHCTIQRATTGGSTATAVNAQPLDPGDAADSATVEYNSTQATGLTLLRAEAWNVQAGWFYNPTPEERIVLGGGDILVVRLEDSPTDSLTINVALVFEEIG